MFDLGGVLVDWSPERIVRRFGLEADRERAVRAALFDSGLWLEFDRGAITETDLARRAAAESGGDVDLLLAIIQSVPETLEPIESSVRLLEDVVAAGHRAFYLSNMTAPSLEILGARRFFGLFCGGIASCRVGLLKPDHAIFIRLIQEFALDAAETVFIDDTAENVRAAADCGLHAIRFTGADRCREEFVAVGVVG